MKIEIKSMTLKNFKGVRSKEIAFSHNMLISGGNKVGKSTIYDAYLWAIFGVLSKKNGTVQPLNADNEPVHKLETSVSVVLNYNDEREVKVERILKEKWNKEGTSDEKLLNTTTERLINDVPLSQKDFTAKLEKLCSLSKWQVLSNVNIFMSYKVDDRRKMLMSLAGEINEEELIKPYPLVYKGVFTERKDIADMLKQQSTIKKKAEDELKMIPAKVQAQDDLKVDADFDALKAEKAQVDKDIASIDAILEGSNEKNPAMDEYNRKVQAHNEKVANAQKVWQDKKIKDIDEITKQIADASTKVSEVMATAKSNFDNYTTAKKKLAEVTISFNTKTKEWNDANEKKFDYQQTDVCPVCGRPYTDDMKAKEYNNAVEEFNKAKSDALSKLLSEATELKQQMAVLKGNVNTFEQITKNADEEAHKNAKEAFDALVRKRTEVQNQSWDNTAEKATFDRDFAELESSKPVIKVDATVEENKDKKRTLVEKRDELLRQLAGEETNKRIEDEKKKLDARSVELSQIIADCNETIRQIKAYKKAKITMVENKVNSYFSLVRWKFYEHNITNDDEKEVCKAIDLDGIDYDNTNDGTVIDMGVDIISGISKASNIFVPLFVDRKESAEKIVPVEQQTIFLQCVYGQELKVESI